MRITRSILLPAIGLLIGASWLCISNSFADQDKKAPPKSKLVAAADEAYKSTQAAYSVFQASVEDVYRWSRRLMIAQQKSGAGKAAAADHVDRMRQLHGKVSALHAAGVKGGEAVDFYSTEYYLLQAEAELAP